MNWYKAQGKIRDYEMHPLRSTALLVAKGGYSTELMRINDDKLRSDKEFIKEAIEIGSGMALCAASKDLREDEELVKIAIKKTPYSMICASKKALDLTDLMWFECQVDKSKCFAFSKGIEFYMDEYPPEFMRKRKTRRCIFSTDI